MTRLADGYGTCKSSMCAADDSISAARWPVDPMPPVEYAIFPGSRRASAMSADSESTPMEGLTAIRMGCVASLVIAANAREGSAAVEPGRLGSDRLRDPRDEERAAVGGRLGDEIRRGCCRRPPHD